MVSAPRVPGVAWRVGGGGVVDEATVAQSEGW
jgi:hypothetical protein